MSKEKMSKSQMGGVRAVRFGGAHEHGDFVCTEKVVQLTFKLWKKKSRVTFLQTDEQHPPHILFPLPLLSKNLITNQHLAMISQAVAKATLRRFLYKSSRSDAIKSFQSVSYTCGGAFPSSTHDHEKRKRDDQRRGRPHTSIITRTLTRSGRSLEFMNQDDQSQ